MIIGYRLLFYAPNRVLCLLYHAKRLILGIKEEWRQEDRKVKGEILLALDNHQVQGVQAEAGFGESFFQFGLVSL